MTFKFIGEDGSMGLSKGDYYKVDVSTCCVKSFTGKKQKCIACYVHTGIMREVLIPYASPQAFAKNWSL